MKTIFFFATLALLTAIGWQGFVKASPMRLCSGRTTEIHGNQRVTVVVRIYFNQDVGYMNISGNYYANNQIFSRISRKIDFTYQVDNARVNLVSKNISKGKDDTIGDDKYDEYFSDFFIHKGRGIQFEMKEARNDALVFALNGIPVFYCNKG